MAVTAISGTDVTITWSAPSDNGSSITGYTVKLGKSDGTFAEDTALCNGVTAKDTRSCTIPMATFMASPYTLPYG